MGVRKQDVVGLFTHFNCSASLGVSVRMPGAPTTAVAITQTAHAI